MENFKPYFCISVELSGDESLRDQISDVFKDTGIECLSDSFHISLLYGENTVDKSKIAKVANETMSVMKKYLENLRSGRIKILKGLATPYFYVVLEVKKDNELMMVIEHLESEFISRQFDNDICTHISLFRIPRQDDAEEFDESAVDILNNVLDSYKRSIKIKVKELKCYDENRELVESKAA